MWCWLSGRVDAGVGLGAVEYFAEDVVADEIDDMDVVAAQVFGVNSGVVELQLGQLHYVCCWVVRSVQTAHSPQLRA